MRYSYLWIASLSFPLHAGAAAPDPRRTPIVEAVERATPAVVTLKVRTAQEEPLLAVRGVPAGSEGSGVVIDVNGTVITNAHVVAGALEIQVTLADGRSFRAELVASDPAVDLAVVRLENAVALPVIPMGDSDALLLGEPAIAIGNPFGLGLTVSTGVVASTGRDMASPQGGMQTYIQTDAAINPGNSGGALVNIHGELIGINTFIRTDGEGIGFAIPVNRAKKITEDLLQFGEVQVPWLGVDIANRQGLRGEPTPPYVVAVVVGSPAERVGLKVGDTLERVAGHPVNSRGDVNNRLAERAPGEVVELVVTREGTAGWFKVRTEHAPEGLGARALREVMGINVSPGSEGLVVTAASGEGTWTRARLEMGDVIVAVDGGKVASAAELVRALDKAKALHRPTAWFMVARGASRGTVEVGI